MVWVVCLGAAACLAFTFGAVGFAVAMFGGLLGASGAGYSSSGYLLLGLFCFVGATLISPMVGFGPGTIGVFSIVVALLFRVLSAACGAPRVDWREVTAPSVRELVFVGIGLLFNVFFSLAVFTHSGLNPDRLIQQYDNPFHFSVVRHILDSGNASPVGAGSVMGAATAIYPSAWHALSALIVSLFRLDIQVAGWIVVLSFVVFVAPIGFHDLYLRFRDNPSMAGKVLSVILPVVLPFSSLEFSYWGSLYANILGLCTVPIALAVLIGCLDDAPVIFIPVRFLWGILSFAVVGFCHPNTVFVLGMFALLHAVGRLPTAISKVSAFAAAIGLWVGFCYSSMFFRTINCSDRIASGIERGIAVCSKLHLDYSILISNEWVLWIVFAVFAMTIVVVCINSKTEQSPIRYTLGICLLTGLTVVALFPETALAKYTVGFWYRDYKRLMAMTLFMSSLIVPISIDFACSTISIALGIENARIRSLGVAFSFAVTLVIAGVGFRYYSFRLSPAGNCINGSGYAMLTDDDGNFFSKVSDIAGSDAVLNNYNDSSVWLYSLYHVNALIKGRPANQISSMSDDLYTAVRGIALAGTDSLDGEKVREALRKLGVRYYLQYQDLPNLTTKFKSDGTIDYQSAGETSVVNDETPGFTKVLSDGRYTLYELIG